MARQIYLPELLKIGIKNYMLYPKGLDYSYNFVKGINLILGGNGMGKTTFVNIIRFALVGLYRRQLDYTRTYKEKAIIKRALYRTDYFSARSGDGVPDKKATVTLTFNINNALFEVQRSLDNGNLLFVSVDGKWLVGEIVSEEKYEKMPEVERGGCLLKKYEDEIYKHSNLSLDDFIFFINEILFFGEDHKTVLWNEGYDNRFDVQNELFNKYFNEPKLDAERQEAQRQAKYYDSLARHKSEDIRVITDLIEAIKSRNDSDPDSVEDEDTYLLNGKLADLKSNLELIQEKRNTISQEIFQLQAEINTESLKTGEIDKEKNRIEKALNIKLWGKLHPQYGIFVENMRLNHICPICNQPNENIVKKAENSSTNCFLCGNKIRLSEDEELMKQYKEIALVHKNIYQSITDKQRRIKVLEKELEGLDHEYIDIDLSRRAIQQQIRESEYKASFESVPSNSQALYDQRLSYEKEKSKFQEKSAEYKGIEQRLTKNIEKEVQENVSVFSAIFARFAEEFLGVRCQLAYENIEGSSIKRFYPIIDGKTRYYEESLSESQRFFIDHAFRMSVLTFFYQTPSFYIVETPDSSLDISYEKNAANVFMEFLKKPNSIIITSNLNNSSFVNHLVKAEGVKFSMVGLLDIAKESATQHTNVQLKSIYNDIKKHIRL